MSKKDVPDIKACTVFSFFVYANLLGWIALLDGYGIMPKETRNLPIAIVLGIYILINIFNFFIFFKINNHKSIQKDFEEGTIHINKLWGKILTALFIFLPFINLVIFTLLNNHVGK